jgi:hypothetical protein
MDKWARIVDIKEKDCTDKMYQIRLQHRTACGHIESVGTFDRAVDCYAARSSGRAGAAYGAVHRARGIYDGFLLEPVPARKMLW